MHSGRKKTLEGGGGDLPKNTIVGGVKRNEGKGKGFFSALVPLHRFPPVLSTTSLSVFGQGTEPERAGSKRNPSLGVRGIVFERGFYAKKTIRVESRADQENLFRSNSGQISAIEKGTQG